MFSGKLEKIIGTTVELKLKIEGDSFCSVVYDIPQAYMKIARKVINELVDIDVLVQSIDIEWKLPSFFHKKELC